jgi:proteasome lid subunit RPN8/RPN11
VRYLTGPSDAESFVDDAVPLANLANRYHAMDRSLPSPGRDYFLIDPLKFAKGPGDEQASSRPMRILYHSHLDVGAYFSETDAAAATMGGDKPSYEELVYLVTSVRQGVVDDHKLFAWDDQGKAFVEIPFELVSAPSPSAPAGGAPNPDRPRD